MFVGGVVVADDVQRHARVGLGDLLEEFEELLVAVVGVAGVGDFAGGDLQRGEQGGGAVADVVVGTACWQAWAHRQHRLGAVQRLDLGLLVDAQHHGGLRRVQVQPDDVADLGLKLGVGGELERLLPPRLDPPVAPDPRDLGEVQPDPAGQQP